jgi:hypothetical protein
MAQLTDATKLLATSLALAWLIRHASAFKDQWQSFQSTARFHITKSDGRMQISKVAGDDAIAFWLNVANQVLSGIASAPPSSVSAPPSSLADCISRGFCTFSFTKKDYKEQTWRSCKTCNQGDNEGVCDVCMKKCHAGHQFGPEKKSTFFCDCPDSGRCSAPKYY